jgi:hypothetical protein
MNQYQHKQYENVLKSKNNLHSHHVDSKNNELNKLIEDK